MKKKQNCMNRVSELMSTPMNQTPRKAAAYISFLSKKYGFCGEICVTGFAAYVQKEEKLKCDDKSYKVNNKDWKEFEAEILKKQCQYCNQPYYDHSEKSCSPY